MELLDCAVIRSSTIFPSLSGFLYWSYFTDTMMVEYHQDLTTWTTHSNNGYFRSKANIVFVYKWLIWHGRRSTVEMYLFLTLERCCLYGMAKIAVAPNDSRWEGLQSPVVQNLLAKVKLFHVLLNPDMPWYLKQYSSSWLLKKPTDLDLHCLSHGMCICINNTGQVIWLAEN